MAKSCYVPLVSGEEWWPAERQTFTVQAEDDAPQKTGLLDAEGRPLYRVKERAPLGFCRNR